MDLVVREETRGKKEWMSGKRGYKQPCLRESSD